MINLMENGIKHFASDPYLAKKGNIAIHNVNRFFGTSIRNRIEVSRGREDGRKVIIIRR